MDWLDSGGFSLYGDTPDYGTAFDFGNTYGSDFGGGLGADSFGVGFSPSYDTSWLNSYINPAPVVPQAPQAPISQPSNPWVGGALGALGPLAGLIGSLASGGAGNTTKPQLSTPQRAAQNQAYASAQGLAPFAAGTTPLQAQQASLLQAIAGGQGLAQPYAAAIEQAFQPQLGSLYEQAANAGRARGFHDAPATSPVGGAILGPGLAQLQGQIAAAKIAQMNALPGMFQQPIQQQFNAQMGQAAQFGNQFPNAFGQTTQTPMGAAFGQGLAGALGGAAAGYNATQQANQQQQFQNSLLSILSKNSGMPVNPYSYTQP